MANVCNVKIINTLLNNSFIVNFEFRLGVGDEIKNVEEIMKFPNNY
jgi:hypothetical protein